MMLVANELEKLILYVGEKKRITLGDVETMVLAAKQRSLYELTDAISAKDRVRALGMLEAILSSGEGEEAAIGHLYMLAKTFRQMLVIFEKRVRDSRALWAGALAGLPRSALCRRGHPAPGAPLQVAPRTDARPAPDRPRRPRPPLQPAQQTPHPRAAGPRPLRRAPPGRSGLGATAVAGVA